MNLNKAREYFSAHYEGTLDPGLKQAFERVLATDATAQAEYRAFVKAVEAINSLRDEEIEIPYNLHDHISARLDKHVWDQKQQRRGSWFGTWWRSLAVAGVASLAILATLVSIFNRNTEGPSTGGVVPSVAAKKVPQVNVKMAGGQLMLEATANGAKTLTITDLDAKTPLGTPIDLVKTPVVSSPLTNQANDPVLLEIMVPGATKLRVALPGKSGSGQEQGSGTVADLAKSMAAHFGCPVRVSEGDLAQPVSWRFKGTTLADAPLTQLDLDTVMVQKQDQMISIVLTGISN